MSIQCSKREVYIRSWTDNVTSTAESFESWDTCMDNKVCKIVAIVGIVLASIFALYIIGAILHCFKSGVTNIYDFFCWCCVCNRKRKESPPVQAYAQNTPMVVYQPVANPAPEYRGNANTYYDERLSATKTETSEMEESYDLEAQSGLFPSTKATSTMKRDEGNDNEVELQTYHPTVLSTSNYLSESSALPSPQQYSIPSDHIDSHYVSTNSEPSQSYLNQATAYVTNVPTTSGQSNANYSAHYSNTPYPQDEFVNNYSRHGM